MAAVRDVSKCDMLNYEFKDSSGGPNFPVDESKSDNESDDTPLMFHSVLENQRRSTMIRPDRSHHQTRVVPCQSWQTQLVINVHITNGTATLRTPLRDLDGNIMSKYHGHLRVSVKDAQLFVSSSHRGDPDVNYVIFNAGTASLQHHGKGIRNTQALFYRKEVSEHLVGFPFGRESTLLAKKFETKQELV
ncbi:hypothetical protein HPB51_003755 [Rhipicephalus microplus]|uniref:Uncharacterized protein n=1 Tax=Rhipicephalus microplus TaxID=6941 RepID=A0A9J6DZT7_RHIMP|nr:hypothetical protein HPB51_003755 [Rhipicephalus microplus]